MTEVKFESETLPLFVDGFAVPLGPGKLQFVGVDLLGSSEYVSR